MQKNSSAEGSGAPWTQISLGFLLLGKSTVDTTNREKILQGQQIWDWPPL